MGNKKLIILISLLFITILSLNIISASSVDNEQISAGQKEIIKIDSNQIDSVQSESNEKDTIQKESVQKDAAQKDTNQIEASQSDNKQTGIGENDNANKTNASNATIKDNKTNIIVKNQSVVKEKKLTVQLKDSKNKAIANRKVTIKIAKNTYTQTTDKNGQVNLKISLMPGQYTVKVIFNGDSSYSKANKTFTMDVYKLKTKFTVPYKSIIRGKYFYAYLKDQNNNPLASKSVKITYKNKLYTIKTDKNGRLKFRINSKVGKYNIKLKYKGTKTYLITIKKLKIKSYDTKTRITLDSKKIYKNKYLKINLLYKTNKTRANEKIIIRFAKKNYKRTTDENGKAYLKLKKPEGTYKVKITFKGSKGFKKSSLTTKIKIINYDLLEFFGKNKTVELNSAKSLRQYIKLLDKNGNPIVGEKVKIKVRCNNFTLGTGIKITKKTIVLSSDGIINKKVDMQRLNDMAKLLRAKGYKVIVNGIGPNYHVNSVKNYKNVCVFSLVGGIDSGMYVDMASNYYQNYLKKNNNQFVLGCLSTSTNVNLANRVYLKRAHDDNYSPKKFKGLYFPGTYLNKKVHVDYVYGKNANELVNNFLKYAVNGKSIGRSNILPKSYTTYTLTTSKNGYVHVDLPVGNYTIVYTLINTKYATSGSTCWVNVVK